jgi:DNA-binding protein YbaB
VTDSSAVSRAERRLAEVAGRTDAASLRHLQGRLDALHVTEASPDGGVSVTVGPSGAVTALRISEAAKDALTASELSVLLMTTMSRAQAKLAAEIAEITHAATGVDDGITQALAAAYTERFPEAVPETVVTPAPDDWQFTRELNLAPEFDDRPKPPKPVVEETSDDAYFRDNPLR